MTPHKNKRFPWILPVILLALSLIMVGCPSGTAPLPTADSPGETDDSENKTGTGGGGSEIPQKPPAETLAGRLNGSTGGNVSFSGNTVTVERNLRVSPSAGLSSIRAAGVMPGDVPSFSVPATVAFVVPAGKTVTVLTGGNIGADSGGAVTIAGTITVEPGGAMKTDPGSAVAVQATGAIKADADTVTVRGSLNVALGASVDNTVAVTGEITGEGARPLLKTKPQVNYAANGTVSVVFTFNETVEAQSPGAEVSGPGKIITVIPQGQTPGTPVKITLTAQYPNSPRSTDFTETVMPAQGFFAPLQGSEGTVAYYDAHGVVGLKTNTTGWFFVEEKHTDWRKLFNAIYTPNAPETADLVEQGKTATAYTPAISKQALGLFIIKFGANYGASTVFLKGEENLPGAKGAEIVVIDLGLPAETPGLTENPNNGLKFLIPNKGLGTAGGDYRHIRLRVNRGAELVIEADNRGYISGGAGHPAETGNFNPGCVEVMAGGRLRDGAYEGFPLGSGAVILNRLGSFLAVGPEPGSPDATGSKAQAYNDYYAGWLIGPQGSSARIEWGTGDQNGNYIEVREGKLAFSANVTVKKTLALMYSVWFVNEPTVTIDVKNDGVTLQGKPGLFAAGDEYKFYGTASESGGQNVGSPKATIIVKPGSTLHKAFLTTGNTDFANFITADSTSGDITINGITGTTAVKYPDDNGMVLGYLNWNIPE
jgi:hypothetical protein